MTSDRILSLLVFIAVFGFFMARLWIALRQYQARRRAYLIGVATLVLFPALGLFLAWRGAPWLIAAAVAVLPAIVQMSFLWQILVTSRALEPQRGIRFAFGRLLVMTPREIPRARVRRRLRRELDALDAWRTPETAALITSTKNLYSSWIASESDPVDGQHAARDRLEAFIRDPLGKESLTDPDCREPDE